MKRSSLFVLTLALAAAGAQEVKRPFVGAPVRGDDGAPLGLVTAVEVGSDGRIVAIEAPGLEPADGDPKLVAALENAYLPRNPAPLANAQG